MFFSICDPKCDVNKLFMNFRDWVGVARLRYEHDHDHKLHYNYVNESSVVSFIIGVDVVVDWIGIYCMIVPDQYVVKEARYGLALEYVRAWVEVGFVKWTAVDDCFELEIT